MNFLREKNMSRIVLVVSLSLLFVLPLAAQEEGGSDGSGIFIGGKIGPSAVLTLGPDSDNLDAAPGMGLGVVFKMILMENLALQAEVLYEMKGFSFDQNVPLVVDLHVRQYLHYLTLPFVVKGVFEIEPVSIEPYAGLALSLLVDAEGVATSGNQEQSEGNTGDYNAIDLGVVFGGEVWFEVVDSFYLTGDIRFAFGFIDIVDGSNDGLYNFAASFLIGAAYEF